MNQGEVYFSVVGDQFDPHQLTSVIGIEPTRVRLRSEPFPKLNSWQFSTGRVTAEIIDVYQMADEVVARLSPQVKELAAFIKSHELAASLNVVLTISLDDQLSTPIIGFTGPVLRFLAEVGATIDVDTYRGSS